MVVSLVRESLSVSPENSGFFGINVICPEFIDGMQTVQQKDIAFVNMTGPNIFMRHDIYYPLP